MAVREDRPAPGFHPGTPAPRSPAWTRFPTQTQGFVWSAIIDPFEKRMDAPSRKNIRTGPRTHAPEPPTPTEVRRRGVGRVRVRRPCSENLQQPQQPSSPSPSRRKRCRKCEIRRGERSRRQREVAGAAAARPLRRRLLDVPRPPPRLPRTKPGPSRADELPPAGRAGRLPASDRSLPPARPQPWERMLDSQNLHLTSVKTCREFPIPFTLRSCG